ncbi:PQQ-dependent sugar dehydrogenase [Vibrio sinaloensis]|uniref:PQQ-dependent sugar dehydrogenase n=1 Tax=Photobacterium sp. (strain ATCC 43367) TaxID=379097 RepID=UPI00205D8CA9|nr:PQQ-dependent sugar dehydrogenase [Vibrio sinaloensis]UPQ86944.1 PQQ-dependent sugar dehydrogenase [Vibrio sinaloensis]
MNKLLFGLLLILVYPAVAAAKWQAQPVVTGLNIPWGLSAVDADRVLVSEKNGTIGILTLSTNNYQVLTKVPNAIEYGQGGLLDIAVSPFNPNHIYVTYAKRVGQEIETTLARADFDGQAISGWRELLVTQSGSDGGRHFGSRITFDQDSVYFSVGDRGERENGQDRTTHAGSILRLTPDGQVPNSNPYVNDDKVLSEIWSYGHRNPQGLFFDSQSNQLWSIEHGPRGGDEINLISKGSNYGWPITSHGKEYWGPINVGEAEEKPGIVSPTKVYVPSIAPSSLILYRGEKHPQLNGKLLAGALKLTHINVLTLQGEAIISEQRLLEDLGERIRNIEALPNGEILFSTDSGKIFRLIKSD